MTTEKDINNIPDPDAAGLIPYFEAPVDEPNPSEDAQ
jgi:hypothetical protein